MAHRETWDHQDLTDRLELSFRRACDHPQVAHWASWYDEASAWVRKQAKRMNTTPQVVAGIVAVLSPQVRWDHQRRFIPGVLDELRRGGSANTLQHPGFTKNKEKAVHLWHQRDEDDPWAVWLSGPKVTAFARALSGETDAVVIDMHMVDAALGLRDTGERFDIHLTDKRYAVMADVITQISHATQREPGEVRELGDISTYHSPQYMGLVQLTPRQVQAVIWGYHREVNRELIDQKDID